MDLNPMDLDRYITGNYGEDQFGEEECPGCEDDENSAHQAPCPLADDDRDFDSMPGGWDYEDDFPLAYEYEGGEDY